MTTYMKLQVTAIVLEIVLVLCAIVLLVANLIEAKYPGAALAALMFLGWGFVLFCDVMKYRWERKNGRA